MKPQILGQFYIVFYIVCRLRKLQTVKDESKPFQKCVYKQVKINYVWAQKLLLVLRE